ncbi:DUF748 domain-containing protein [Chitinibacter sp. SCUT-21]|uniref:DUF748 domain-containing protein n=1 Tax=Chitinibacter sp. SCUT-21 TaxID=2970891 RepID=UPI0035A73904
MKKLSLRLAYLSGAFIILGLLCALAVPPLLKPYLERKASQALQREVHLGKISLNPFLFRVGVEDLHVKDRFGEFIAAKSVDVDAEFMSVIRGGPVLREITLREPKINLVRLNESTFNFTDLLQSDSATEEDAEPMKFSLNNIRIIQGDFRLDDRQRGVKIQLDQLELAIPFLSNMPQRIDEYITPALSGRINGKPFSLQGQSKLFKDTHDTSLRFSSTALELTDYLGYTPLPSAMNLLAGKLSTELDIVFRQEKDRATLLLNGQARLNDLQLQLNHKDALSIGQLSLALNDFKPLLGDFHFQRVDVDGLKLIAERDAQGQVNWLAMQAAQTTKIQKKVASAVSRERAKSTRQTVFSVGQFALKNSQLTWHDQFVKPAVNQTWTDLSVVGRNWSSATDKAFPIELSVKNEQGAALTVNLQASTLPLKIAGNSQLTALQLHDFHSYYAPYLNGDLRALLGATIGFEFQAEPLVYKLQADQISLQQLALALPRQEKPAIKINEFGIKGMTLDSQSQTLEIQQIASQQGFIDVALLPDQQVNLQQLIPASPASANPSKAAKSPAWRVKLADTQIDDFSVRIQDRKLAKPTPVLFKNITLNVKNIDSQAKVQSQLALSAKAGRNASMKVQGPFVAQPFSAQWQIDARNLDAAYVQPYFGRYLNISLASGYVDAKGRLNLSTAPKFTGAFAGDLGVKLFYALDKSTGEDFLKWKSLALNGVNTQFDPVKVDIQEIKLDNFYSRLILSPNGRMNVQDIMVGEEGATSVTRESTLAKKNAEQPASVPSKAEPVPIRIGKITLSQGNIRYSDLLIQPNYTANLTAMGGEISGLSSQNDTRAKLDLKGSVDKIAPVQIQGTLNPLAKDVFIEIKGGVKGYELTAASTYAEKYAGYGITKGKLSMDVAYLVENRKLSATNNIFLDQLTLSDQASNSPDATKLPVKFALSLLTNRHGQIKLNLPIEGSLDDPDFKVGSVIWQVIGNVLEKAITAPFDLIAGAFSGGPSLSYITFEPGSARLNEGAQTSIARLAEMLNDRPALTMEIAGWADLAIDEQGLKERQLRQKMRSAKAAKLGESTESIETERDLLVSETEEAELIEAVYKKSKFEKPTNMLGLNKKLPSDEMKALILKNTVIDEAALQELANRRAQRVNEGLKEAGIAAERLFITQPQLNPVPAQTEKDQGPSSRVQFKLQ